MTEPKTGKETMSRVMVPVVESGSDESAETAIDYRVLHLQSVADADRVASEYAAFRAKVAEVGVREGRRLGGCEKMVEILREVGLTDDELPKTHAEVQITRTYRVPLEADRITGEPFPDFGAMEGIVRHDAYNNGFSARDVKVVRLVTGA